MKPYLGRVRPTLPLVIVGLASFLVFMVMQPWWLLNPSTPTGGDMGSHVLGPAFLRDVLLPQGRVMGWSQDWFAGFPAFYFYFPIPSLVIVLLDVFIPYGVAFKLVTTFGLLGMAPAAYFHARAIKLSRTVSAVAACSAVVLIFFESYSIYGANLASTLAGEFSFAWSFSFSLVYLGFLIKAVADDRKYVKWAALFLGLTALTHILTTIVAVFASLFVIAWKRGALRTLLIWAWGFAIAGFWALPLAMRIGLTSDMGWIPLSRWEEVFPVELWLLLPLAIPGAIWVMRTTRRGGPLIGATLLPVIYFPLPNILPELFPDFFGGERWKLWNGRLLPYWYFGVAFFAAVGVGAAVVWMSRRLPERISSHFARALVLVSTAVAVGLVAVSTKVQDLGLVPAWILPLVAGLLILGITFLIMPPVITTRGFLTATAAALLVLGTMSSITYVDGWARWNYEGYENKEPWEEYEALMAAISELPPGRVMWEANNDGWNRYGTPMAPMLIPYWTEGTHKSMEGLFFESSITTPFHFINHSEMSFKPSNPIPGLRYHTFDMERGLAHMDVYGVDYYVSVTPEATEKAKGIQGFELLEEVPPFAIFRLPDTELVEVATHLPAVYDVPERGLLGALIGSETVVGPDGEPLPSFHDLALEWYEDVDDMDRWVVAGGPEEWPRITSLAQRPDTPIQARGEVSEIVVDHHRISFRTEAVGAPHLVKVSYFPNWKATGAEGPWRATPSLMVVVPTQNEVVLEFVDTMPETVGKILTLLGVLALVGVAFWERMDRQRSERPAS
ncbi:MAG TPA: hypothetical protein VF246_05580 [Acidimicrobiia bacterium]